MNEIVERREIAPVRAAVLRYEGTLAGARRAFPRVFQAIQGRVCGAPFFCYYEMDPTAKSGVLDLCVPTEETPVWQGVAVQVFPRVQAYAITHRGSYETIGTAYSAIDKAAREDGLLLCPPFREVYFKGAGRFLKGNPKNYITEIQFPWKEGAPCQLLKPGI